MPRTYGDKFLLRLYSDSTKGKGAELAKACIKANIPAAYAATALGVSRITIHAWFRGTSIRQANLRVVEAFMTLIGKDIEAGLLPVQDLKGAKKYIENMTGKTL
jgi:hypothetical protein